MFEEMNWRSYLTYTARLPSSNEYHKKIFGHWYSQLEKDSQKFGININPWWQEDTKPYAMINGEHVEWNDGRWEPYTVPKEVFALLEERRREVSKL